MEHAICKQKPLKCEVNPPEELAHRLRNMNISSGKYELLVPPAREYESLYNSSVRMAKTPRDYDYDYISQKSEEIHGNKPHYQGQERKCRYSDAEADFNLHPQGPKYRYCKDDRKHKDSEGHRYKFEKDKHKHRSRRPSTSSSESGSSSREKHGRRHKKRNKHRSNSSSSTSSSSRHRYYRHSSFESSSSSNVRTMLPVKVVGPNNDERNFVIESGTDQDYNCDNSVTSKFGILNTTSITEKLTSAKSSEEVGTAVCATEVIPSNEDAPVRSVSKSISGNGAEAACRLSLALDSDTDLQILPDNTVEICLREPVKISQERLFYL